MATELPVVFDTVTFEEESKVAERWLNWCKTQDNVKCIESVVPPEIFPGRNVHGILIDVKVGGRKRCPDDVIYGRHEELRSKVARGNCVLSLRYRTDQGLLKTSYFFLIFALRKFSGGMGDEDEDSESCQNQWQKYFLQPINLANKIVVTDKANGEAGHLSCRKIAGATFFCIGSKNVHLLVKDRADLQYYTDSRYNTAVVVAKSFFSTYMENPSIAHDSHKQLISFLRKSKYTAVMELLQPEYQHIEDLSYLAEPELRFICWTSIYCEDDQNSLCSVPPNFGIDWAREFKLSTISYEVIDADDADEYMQKIRSERNYEGKVLYFMDSTNNVFGLIKKKTAWYIVLRAIREQACHFASKSTYSESEISTGVTKRLSAIQRWLGYSNDYRASWQKLGAAFAQWLVHKARKGNTGGREAVNLRAKFPQLFKEFLEGHPDLENSYNNLVYS